MKRPTDRQVRRLEALALAVIAAGVLVQLLGCTTTTEVVVECEEMEVFPNDSIATVADSVRFDRCDEPSWNGKVIRRVPGP